MLRAPLGDGFCMGLNFFGRELTGWKLLCRKHPFDLEPLVVKRLFSLTLNPSPAGRGNPAEAVGLTESHRQSSGDIFF